MASTAELLRQARAARATMTDRVRPLTPEQGEFKPAEDRWSAAEVLEHLTRAEAGGIRSMWLALHSARRGEPVWKDAHPYRDRRLDEIAARTMRPKEKAPSDAQPTAGGPAAFWLAALAANQLLLERLAAEVHEDELDAVVIPHFLMGPLTIRQRFEFIRWHIEHHIPQVEALARHPALPAGDGKRGARG